MDSRSYDQCAEIFRDLGLWKVRVVSNNPTRIRALQEGGLEVERVALEIQPVVASMRYLRTKREKMGHLISVA